MTKKRIRIIVLVAVLVVTASIIFLTALRALGSINNRYAEATTASSNISFSGEAGDKFRFLFQSDVESGDLDIVLYDSSGNEVYVEALDFDRAKKLETYFSLDRSDEYTLAAECNNFVGNYEIKIFNAIGF